MALYLKLLLNTFLHSLFNIHVFIRDIFIFNSILYMFLSENAIIQQSFYIQAPDVKTISFLYHDNFLYCNNNMVNHGRHFEWFSPACIPEFCGRNSCQIDSYRYPRSPFTTCVYLRIIHLIPERLFLLLISCFESSLLLQISLKYEKGVRRFTSFFGA